MNAVNPTRIMTTTDFSESASCAFPYATALARHHGAELMVVHVIVGHAEYLANREILQSYERSIREHAIARLARLELDPGRGSEIRREVTSAWSAAAGVVDFAESEQPDLIVMATHGHRLLRQLVLGSVARGVIGRAPCPVLCVKCAESRMLAGPRGKLRVERILVPVDLSDHSRTALHLACRYAASFNAQLHLMYVVHVDVPPHLLTDDARTTFALDEEAEAHIAARLREFGRDADPGVDRVVSLVEKGSPARQIARYARALDVDLIVLSRRGLGDTPHALGSVAERLLHDAPCPMLVA